MLGLKVPNKQTVGAVTPAPHHEPAGHTVTVDVVGQKLPPAHTGHMDCLLLGWYVPTAQLEQADADAAENLPTPHAVQPGAIAAENVPALHAVQLDAEAAEKNPTSQGMHVRCPGFPW